MDESLSERLQAFLLAIWPDHRELSIQELDSCIFELYERIKDRPEEGWQLTAKYAALQICKTLKLVRKESYLQALNSLDMAIIVCGPSELLLDFADFTESCVQPSRKHFTLTETIPQITSQSLALKRLTYPSIEEFLDAVHSPFLLDSLIADWPALSKWMRMDYLVDILGHRLVPIEIGPHYLDSTWTQEVMPFSEFIEIYVCDENPPAIAYLAQYDLLAAIPRLAQDVQEIDYCYLEIASNSSLPSPMRNIWIGPKNCFTPLHHDKYNNIFCQLFGYKRFRLFSPEVVESLDLDPEHFHSNTLKVI